MKIYVAFEMSVDEEQCYDGTLDWNLTRIEGAVEETVRAAIGFAVPFSQGNAVSVGGFKFDRESAPSPSTALPVSPADEIRQQCGYLAGLGILCMLEEGHAGPHVDAPTPDTPSSTLEGGGKP